MKLLHYYAQALTHASGVTAAIDSWTKAQSRHGHNVKIVSAGGAELPQLYSVEHQVIPHLGSKRSNLLPSPLSLLKCLRKADILILHEGWTLSHYAAALCAILARTPYVVVPHGVYEPAITESLKRPHRLRAIAEAWLLRHAASVHVFFDSERALVRRISPRASTFTAPTGRQEVKVVPRRRAEDSPVLWFGRIDIRHKGLDLMLNGLAIVPPDSRPSLRLAGYDFGGDLERLKRLIESLELGEWVVLEPPLDEAQKAVALATCKAYVHPSRWECHSIALLEALESKAPVYVSSDVHIAELLKSTRSAELVENTPRGWAAAFKQIYHSRLNFVERDVLWKHLDWERSIEASTSHYRVAVRANGTT